ncbi:hypothetical protein [Paenibacillus sp. 2KB_22]|uniref:hypothetical protein n=1 Tax=Paenibacillus sp. 2KB_22 TaxID=3232978 RepID=UPI003F9D6679
MILSINRMEKIPEFGFIKISQYRGYDVIICDEIEHEAMLLTFNDGKPPRIVVGKSFFTYPDESQEFMLLHEMGHDVYKHSSTSADGLGYSSEELIAIYEYERRLGKKLPDEFEADQYAISIIGKEAALLTFNLFADKYKQKSFDAKDTDAIEALQITLDEISKRSEGVSK